MNGLGKFLSVFWWARGATAVVALISILAPVLEIEKYELLTVLHAIVISWDYLIVWVSSFLSIWLPFGVWRYSIIAFVLVAGITGPFFLVTFREVRWRLVIVSKKRRFRHFKKLAYRGNFLRASLSISAMVISVLILILAVSADSALLNSFDEFRWKLSKQEVVTTPKEQQEFYGIELTEEVLAPTSQCIYELPFSADCFERSTGADLNCAEHDWIDGGETGFLFADKYCWVDAWLFSNIVVIGFPMLAFTLPFFFFLLALSRSYRIGAINAVLAIVVLEALYFAPHVGGKLELWASQTVESKSPTGSFIEQYFPKSISSNQ